MAMTDTEKASTYDHLEQMTTEEILLGINAEDVSVPLAVGESIPQIKESLNNALAVGGLSNQFAELVVLDGS